MLDLVANGSEKKHEKKENEVRAKRAKKNEILEIMKIWGIMKMLPFTFRRTDRSRTQD